MRELNEAPEQHTAQAVEHLRKLNLQPSAWCASALCLALLGCGAQAESFGTEEVEATQERLAMDQDPLATGVSITSLTKLPGTNLDCADLGCEGFAPTVSYTGGRRGRGSNSQLALGRNLYQGDINGDQKTDLIQHESKRIFVSQNDVNYTEISHLTLPESIGRLVIGDFYGAGWDQLCALTASNTYCFGADPSRSHELRLWFRMGSAPIAADEDVIVGNYDPDAADELFIYNKSTGAYRMLEYGVVNGDQVLASKTNFTPGNLNGRLGANMQVRAGDFTGDGRTDLIAVNATRQVIAFAAATSGSNHTFWWNFTTASNAVASNEEYFLAKVNTDAKDDLVLHDVSTGATRFKKVEVSAPLLDTSTGQLHVLPNSKLRPSWGPLAAAPRDNMVMLVGDQTYYSYASATSSGGQDTYWWGWNRGAPNNHTGWPSTQVRKVLYVPCKFSNDNGEPVSDAVLAKNYDRIRDFFWENTYGRRDLQYESTDWAQVSFSSTSDEAKERSIIGEQCARAAGKVPKDYDVVVIIKNLNQGDAWNSGRYAVMPPNRWDTFYTVHEIGHAMGMTHTRNDSPSFRDADSPYGNPWSFMSASVGFTYNNPLGLAEGPNMTAPNLSVFSALPSARIKTLPSGFSKQKVWLSAVNRPATGEFNEVRIPDNEDPTMVYSAEFREVSGFDKNIPRQTVILHHTTVGDDGRLITQQDGVYQLHENRHSRDWNTSERQPGERFTTPRMGTLEVLRFVDHMAEVEITP